MRRRPRGGPVVELQDDDARNFMFVAPESIVLGSFSMLNGAFFVLVGTTCGYRDSHQEHGFQLRVYTPRSKVVLTTNKADAQGVVWSHSASSSEVIRDPAGHRTRLRSSAAKVRLPKPVRHPIPVPYRFRPYCGPYLSVQ